MSKFPAWFNRAYKRWSRSQPGEEDFIGFCDLLGYPPSKVLGWMNGEFIPEEAEVLSIAGIFGISVYKILNLPKPDPELLKIFNMFSHLHGQDRPKLALAIFEAEGYFKERSISTGSHEAKEILRNVFEKYGLNE